MQLCCIPLRDLRYLRENIHARVLNQSAKKKTHVSPADLADDADKPQNNNNQTVFLCDIMQPAAFLCVICVICGRIHARGLKQSAQKKPQCLPQITLIYADKPKTTLTTQNCLSLRYDAACCIPLRDLRYLRENTRKSTQTIRTEETPMSPADLADLRRQNPKQQNSLNFTKLSFSAI